MATFSGEYNRKVTQGMWLDSFGSGEGLFLILVCFALLCHFIWHSKLVQGTDFYKTCIFMLYVSSKYVALFLFTNSQLKSMTNSC